jgi:hypothetical protein
MSGCFLLPLWEKVDAVRGRMRGIAPDRYPSSVSFADTFSLKGRREAASIVVQQNPCFDTKGFGNSGNIINADISFRTFDTTQVRAVNAAVEGKSLLRQATFGAKPTHVFCDHIAHWSGVISLHKEKTPS